MISNNHEPMRPRLIVIGDANLDIITDLRQVDLRDFGRSNIDYVNGVGGSQVDVHTIAGGGGFLFACAAQAAGFDTNLISGFGCDGDDQPDLAGKVVLQSLTQAGVNCLYAKKLNERSGKILIIYLANDHRMMISDRGANAKFDMEDITPEMREKVAHSNLLHVSGYSLLEPRQRTVVVALAQLAKEHGVLTSLDVVPHKLYKVFTYQQFLEISRVFDVITIELATALGFMGNHIDTFPKLEINMKHPAVAEFLKHHACLVLRPTSETQTIFMADSQFTESTGWSGVVNTAGYSGVVNATGYLDKLLAKTLYTIWGQWIAKFKSTGAS